MNSPTHHQTELNSTQKTNAGKIKALFQILECLEQSSTELFTVKPCTPLPLENIVPVAYQPVKVKQLPLPPLPETQQDLSTVQPQQHEMPIPLQPLKDFIVATFEGIVETQIRQSPWYTVKELWVGVQSVNCERAADAMGVEVHTIRQWIKSGILLASKVGRDYSIRLQDLDNLLKEHQQPKVVSIMDKHYKKYKSKF